MAQVMKWLLITILIVLSVLVVIPPIRYHYVYPTAGDDTAYHLRYYQDMEKKGTGLPLYYGQYLVGKLVNALPFDHKVSFLWFHFTVMIMALWAIGLTVGLAVNWLAGILSVLMVFGVSQLVPLFEWGQIFDIVGIAILLPVLLLCLCKIDKGIWWKVGTVVSLVAFMVFHANGRYIYALLPIVLAYEVALVLMSRKYKIFVRKLQKYRYPIFAGLLGIVLVLLFAVGFSLDAGRLWMDSTILLIISICGWVGLYLGKKGVLVSIGIILLAFGLAMPNMELWMQNNSAVKDVDKEAIAYLNSLNGQTYTASSQVAEWIYDLYVNKTFDESATADYVVTRTTPMTPQSAIGNMYFVNQDRLGIEKEIVVNGYNLLKEFYDGEKDRVTAYPIKVAIYGR